MNLLIAHKNERRERILAATRKIVAERGYEGLTMRDLAEDARVSVQTLYNLFGTKDEIMMAGLQALAVSLGEVHSSPGSTFFQRGLTCFEAGMRLIAQDQEYYRAVMLRLFTSTNTGAMRRQIEAAFCALIEWYLADAKSAGQLAEWADPRIVALHALALQSSALLTWSLGHIDFFMFRAAAYSGLCHVLAGVARGPFLAEVEARMQEIAGSDLVGKYIKPST